MFITAASWALKSGRGASIMSAVGWRLLVSKTGQARSNSELEGGDQNTIVCAQVLITG